MLRIAAIVTTLFWLAALVFVCFNLRTVSGEGGRYILEMATISVFGMAIVEAIRDRSNVLK